MDTHPACQLLDLANNECCGIALCPQCQVLHLRIGPLSLKLAPHIFQAVCAAMQQAAAKLPAHLPPRRPWPRVARTHVTEPKEKPQGETTMLMIGNPTPDLEVEALMPDGRFEHLRLSALLGRWAVLFFIAGLNRGGQP